MSDENTGAKFGTESVSPAEANVEPKLEANSPAAANAAPEATEENTPFHKHPRFQELVSEKNQLKNKISEMERILQERSEPKGPTPFEMAKQEIASLGLDDKATEKLLKAVQYITKGDIEANVAPMQQALAAKEIETWVDNFSKEHKDYVELEPKMAETFASLPEATQRMLASDPMGTQLLYDHVKQQRVDEELKKSYEKGVNDGYKNKQNKSAGSPTTGGSVNPPGELTREAIKNMSIEEYKKNRAQIMAALSTLKD